MSNYQGIGLRAADAQRFESRAAYSQSTLRAFSARLNKARHPESFAALTIYAAGSYGRLEASRHSDIDLFFVLSKPRESFDEIRVPEVRLLSEIIDIGYSMSFPKFSNDGHFLKFLFLNDILDNLGSPIDDYQNHFTARMLLLLESRPVYGDAVYKKLLKETIRTYFRDYEHHPKDFKPTFLINDIIRFWKTLCLNYEHKRNEAKSRNVIKHKIKNFKLGYSRLMTCFATVAALSTYRKTISPDEVVGICSITPAARLLKIAHANPKVAPKVRDALLLYAWFLQKTALSTPQLEKYFALKKNRTEAFLHARKFGDSIYSILESLDDENKYMRYLVV